MATFLLKTEPGDYSFADLVRDKKTSWTGVKNPAAQAALRSVKKGDEAFIYHTGAEKQIVGLARFTGAAYADPADKAGKLVAADLAPVRAAKEPVTLSRVKADARFKDFALVRQSRLSVMAVPPNLDKILREWAGF
ncbi:MAG TPA: EVE domain-containing protein [Phycisphaerales bacterium]|nr:EVE domain-containing protein [Phycisphaerales bacterium]